MSWAREQRTLKRVGIPIADAVASYRPGGYPSLGLAPLRETFADVDSLGIQARLQSALRQGGNPRARIVGMGKLDSELSDELASVVLAVSERFPGVRIDRIDFSADLSDLGANTLAAAYAARAKWPGLHSVACEIQEPDVRYVVDALEDLWHGLDWDTQARTIREAAWITRGDYVRDATAHGSLELSQCFGHPECYGTLQSYWEHRRRYGERLGKPARAIPHKVSAATFVMLHEMGHIVEWATEELGEEAHQYVLYELERALLYTPGGRARIPVGALEAEGLVRADVHLINYPRGLVPAAGEGEYRRAQRRVVTPIVAPLLGTYAPRYGEEIFAEAFALSLSAQDPELRERLAPFQEALREVGIGARRRRALTGDV